MEEEKLIELVRERKVLFDPREKKYMDNNHKSAIWRDIASQCGLSSGDCAKDLWKKLRDSYRSSLKRKRNPKSGSAASSTYTWKYEHLMSFLQPYMKDRFRTTNELASTSQVIEGTEKELGDFSDTNPEGEIEEVEIDIDEDTMPVRHSSSSKTKTPVLQFLENEAKKKEKRASEREALKRKLLQPEDGLKLFFDSMYAATKNLPNHLQRRVKRGLLNMVSDAEDEAEMWSTPSSVGTEGFTPVNTTLYTNINCTTQPLLDTQ